MSAGGAVGAAALPPHRLFIHRMASSEGPEQFHQLSELARGEPPLPDHRAAINRHHVASFYDKVRGKRVRGERPAGEWQLRVTRIKAAQHRSSRLGRDQKLEPSGSLWAPQALPLVVP